MDSDQEFLQHAEHPDRWAVSSLGPGEAVIGQASSRLAPAHRI